MQRWLSKPLMHGYPKRAALCAALFYSLKLLSLVIYGVGSLLGGCASPKDQLATLARNSSLRQPLTLETKTFTLMGWGKNNATSHMNVYIEGDGQAWLDPWTVSSDPTPLDPMGFRLALADRRPDSVVYLARPCQYSIDKRCAPSDWTSDRFSAKVVAAYHQALDQIKETWGARTISLHAYSGGATVALLVAARRHDIKRVVTFAPLLDPVSWANHHHYSPLTGSLSPLTETVSLRRIPQEHFIGLADQEVPLSISVPYFARMPDSPTIVIHKIPEFHHHSDWPGLWKSFILKRQSEHP